MTDPSQTTRRNRRRWWWLGAPIALIVLATGAWLAGLRPSAYYQWQRAALMEDLAGDNPAVRQRAAWRVIEYPDPFLETYMADVLVGGEADDRVREAFAYALGRTGNPQNFEALQLAAELDPSGYVRAAAWLSAAHLDPARFVTLAETTPVESDWERIGVAQGMLVVGDPRGVPVLLDAAEHGDLTQQVVAGRALQKHLQPLLDAAGAWPLGVHPELGMKWTSDEIAAVRAAYKGVDLRRVADDSLPRQADLAALERKVKRIMRGRNRIAEMLDG